ncbi:hypothetical protein Ae201684P_006742 [Aphanomyces euteiches]|nr:hypothetical protein Ae201684P_006742 [Aphanomyces euteiches]
MVPWSKFLVRGLGFFNDAYDLFVMNVVNVVLEEQYGSDVYTPALKGAVSAAALIGAVIGQIVFGYLADILGRRINMIITCGILILGGVICALASGGSPTNTLWILVVARGILGVGIGGEYPLAASASAEDASSVTERNQRVALTFSLQGVGCLTAAIMGNLYVAAYASGPRGSASKGDLEFIWRSLFGIGIIPSALVFFFRYRAEETVAFAAQTNQQSKRIPLMFVVKVYGRWLLGTAGTWFLFDIVFYAQNLFSATILSVVGITEPTLMHVTTQNILVACVALPGYYVAVYFINRVGRRMMQVQGFVWMTLLFLILSDDLHLVVVCAALRPRALLLQFWAQHVDVCPANGNVSNANSGALSWIFRRDGETWCRHWILWLCRDWSKLCIGTTFGVFAFFCMLSIPLTWFCTFDNPNPLSDGDAEFDRRLRIYIGAALQDEDFTDVDETIDEEIEVDIGSPLQVKNESSNVVS